MYQDVDLSQAEAAESDPQLAYRMDANERPLLWIGNGLREFGIEPGSELKPDQWDMARAMMKGSDPRTGEQLVTPKMAVDPRSKLAARPLVEAIKQQAADRGVEPVTLLKSKRKRDAYARMESGVKRLGEAHRVRLGDISKLADALNIDAVALYGAQAINLAVQHEGDRVQVGNRGFDLTITLPKPYSVALAFAQGDFADQLEGVFTESLHEAVQAAEGWTAYGMRGHHGDNESAERIGSSGFLGWVNFHRAARPVGDAPFGDPHMHGHVTIAHLCKGTDGKWSTLAAGGRDLYRHASAIDALMQARVRAVTHEQWGFEWKRNGDTDVWEIVGIPPETVALFSKRSAEVRALFEALNLPFEEATTAQQKAAAAKLAQAKKTEATTAPDEQLRAYWRAEAEAAEQDPDAILSAVLRSSYTPATAAEAVVPQDVADIHAVAQWVFRPDEGLTSHQKDFTRAEALAAVMDAARNGIGGLAEAELLTDRVLSHRGMAIRLDEKLPAHMSNVQRYTTADIIEAERRILSEVRGRFSASTSVVSEETFRMAVSTYETIQRVTNPQFSLSAEQLSVLRRILRDGHGIDAVIGVAGAGKTTIMEVARIAWEADGQVIRGASTAAVAAANLRMEAGIQASTMAGILTQIRSGKAPLQGVDVLVVDEAAMVDDRQLAHLLSHAGQTGTKVVGIGDPEQLQSPGVGGAFAAIHRVVGGESLTTNYRQKDAVERRALELWRDHERQEALRAWADHGRIHAASTRDEAMAGMLTAWQDRRTPHTDVHDQVANVLLLAARNADVDQLNTAGRAIRRAEGELLGPDVEFAQRGGGTIAFTAGDIVLVRTNDYRSRENAGHSDILNGFRGIVTEVDAQRGVQIEWREKTAGGGTTLLREWVDGDFIAAGGLSHGIAMTVHKAQGLTAHHALVYGPGLAANGAYTALSRDKYRVDLFLPHDAFGDEERRAAMGEPATEAEAMDRLLWEFAASLEARDTQEGLIVTELGEQLDPLIEVPETEQAQTVTTADRARDEERDDVLRAAARDVADRVGIDAGDLIDARGWDDLTQALDEAQAAGYDPHTVLEEAATGRTLDDVHTPAAVLAYRVREHLADAGEQEPTDEHQEADEALQEAAEAYAAEADSDAETAEEESQEDHWRGRPFGQLTDAELIPAIAEAMTIAQAAAQRANQAQDEADRKAAALEMGMGEREQAVSEYADQLSTRAAAVSELGQVEEAHETAGAEVIALRAELSGLESAQGGRRKEREARAVQAAQIREDLETVTRRVVELDIQRERLEGAAGPKPGRAAAVRQHQEMQRTLPQQLATARTSDREDATRAAQTAGIARSNATALTARRDALRGEQDIRGRLPAQQARADAERRAADRAAVSAHGEQQHEQAEIDDQAYRAQSEQQDGPGRSL
ncbi:MobF family relaxase [Streptomyces celluloflavus]|uniref:MobF family relaxase n=1 Tax=Streptomyces celluloflavus TaxID=58344 RepID=UPI0036B87B2D